MSNFSFVKNNFQIRSSTKIYDKKTSSAVGLAREKIKDANSRDAFIDTNLLVGDFIMQVFPEKNLQTDYMFDDFLASAKLSQAMDVNSTDFSPFLAVVNIPEITHISTPVTNDGSADYNRKIRDIIVTLGVFKLYNYTGYEFAVPNYGDPVQVTFKDMDTFSDPIFIRPLKTGVVNIPGAPGGFQNGSGFYDECGRKRNVVTKIARGPRPKPSIITSDKKINKFITSMDQVNVFKATSNKATKNGEGTDTAETDYSIVIPKNINPKEAVNVFLYFHGDNNSGKPEKLITKGPSFMPDGYNCVLLWPNLATVASSNTRYTVTPQFVDEVLKHGVGLEGGVDQVLTFSHSGGGGPHGYFLKQVAQKGIFNDFITASRFLDADYGFNSITQLFKGLADGSIPAIDQSRITFLVGLKHKARPKNNAPWQMATKGSGERWNNVYNSGTRLIKMNTGHYPPAYQIGPEYLIPEVVSVSAPAPQSEKPSPNDKADKNAGDQEKQVTDASPNESPEGTGENKVEQNEKNPLAQINEEIAALQEKIEVYYVQMDALVAANGGKEPTSAFNGKDQYDQLTEEAFQLIDQQDKLKNKRDELKGDLKSEQEALKAYEKKFGPSKPSKDKEDKNTPNTANPPAPTQSECPPAGSYYNYPGPYPPELKWIQCGNFPPRVNLMQNVKNHAWGTLKMRNFLKGLNNVKGGEDLGKGYKNPTKLYPNKPSKWVPKELVGKDKQAIPSDIKPGYYYGDISRKPGGDTWNRHITHQTGIGVDLSIPTKYVDPNGRVFRGMNVRVNPRMAKKGKPSGNSPKFWGMKGGTTPLTREYIDEIALMSFLLYAIPLCGVIIFGVDQVKYAIELIEDWSRKGKEGWSLTHQAYREAKWRGRKFPAGQEPKQYCKLTGDDPVHNNHFHIRLRGPGVAPGPFNKRGRVLYPADARPGIDKRGGYYGTRKDQGDGRVDPGSPGYTPPKSDYKK